MPAAAAAHHCRCVACAEAGRGAYLFHLFVSKEEDEDILDWTGQELGARSIKLPPGRRGYRGTVSGKTAACGNRFYSCKLKARVFLSRPCKKQDRRCLAGSKSEKRRGGKTFQGGGCAGAPWLNADETCCCSGKKRILSALPSYLSGYTGVAVCPLYRKPASIPESHTPGINTRSPACISTIINRKIVSIPLNKSSGTIFAP